ncbi:VirB6/TrbL-like conjugal transfer protein, CD1112 family [Clostridium sp.]|jgi:hypothetical protein|uniref:VirB6/TrbL-like conjugal transfer protein, CD1112 family n=1 Tax=Clostridium sp. TaxID=1506 RepID=UPI002901C4EF|nr:CD0415/CD1112 family protein [Clostridium sp.]MDU2155270.1 CD0415/CD1112 family protein [Clostridium sp.]
MDIIGEWLNENLFQKFIEFCLNSFSNIFNASLKVLETEVGKTPVEFSSTIVSTLENISDNVIMPIAGLILTYILCYEIVNMMTERNNMADFDVKNVFVVLFKTSLGIILVSNCFDITLAFFDLGQTLVQNISVGSVTTIDIQNIIKSLIDDAGANIGLGAIYTLFSFLIWLGGLVATGLVYLVAWGRMVTILIYVSISPIPFATFFNKDWIGGIGQNYLKNLAALALQGFLMLVCLIVYGGLVKMVSPMIQDSGGITGLIMLLVTMFVCVKTLMGCLNFAKSIFNAQ